MAEAKLLTVERVILRSGVTADRRFVSKETVKQLAETYDPEKTYAARVNMEHCLSPFPESLFHVYGTVVSLRTKEEGDELELVATIAITEETQKIWDKFQKRAFSVEYVDDAFKTGKPYLFGLAITDTPASQGTHFSRLTSSQITQGVSAMAENTSQQAAPVSPPNTVQQMTAAVQDKPQEQPAAQTDKASTAQQAFGVAEFAQQIGAMAIKLATVEAEAAKYKAEAEAAKAELEKFQSTTPAANQFATQTLPLGGEQVQQPQLTDC